MFINVNPTRSLRLVLFLILLAYILNLNAFKQEDDEEDDFLDIGVRLTGDKRDSLIADLIAEEKDILNAGHVNT